MCACVAHMREPSCVHNLCSAHNLLRSACASLRRRESEALNALCAYKLCCCATRVIDHKCTRCTAKCSRPLVCICLCCVYKALRSGCARLRRHGDGLQLLLNDLLKKTCDLQCCSVVTLPFPDSDLCIAYSLGATSHLRWTLKAHDTNSTHLAVPEQCFVKRAPSCPQGGEFLVYLGSF